MWRAAGNRSLFQDSFNILHRDVKLSNIIIVQQNQDTKFNLDEDYEAVLIDFDVSREVENANKPDKATCKVGTRGYIAPEVEEMQKEGKAVYDGKIDVYSLGITILHMLTGA